MSEAANPQRISHKPSLGFRHSNSQQRGGEWAEWLQVTETPQELNPAEVCRIPSANTTPGHGLKIASGATQVSYEQETEIHTDSPHWTRKDWKRPWLVWWVQVWVSQRTRAPLRHKGSPAWGLWLIKLHPNIWNDDADKSMCTALSAEAFLQHWNRLSEVFKSNILFLAWFDTFNECDKRLLLH